MTLPDEPEAGGIPDTADDTSTAYDEHDRPKFDDSPAALPGDDPVAVDDYGVTAFESSHSEPLKARLLRESKDISPDDAQTAADTVIAGEAVTDDAIKQAARDADVLGEGETAEDLNTPFTSRVGRLVAPDEGGLSDDESQSIAYDSGEFQGMSAEEAAMHEVPEEEVSYKEDE